MASADEERRAPSSSLGAGAALEINRGVVKANTPTLTGLVIRDGVPFGVAVIWGDHVVLGAHPVWRMREVLGPGSLAKSSLGFSEREAAREGVWGTRKANLPASSLGGRRTRGRVPNGRVK